MHKYFQKVSILFLSGFVYCASVKAQAPLNASKECHSDIIEWIEENAPNYNVAGLSLAIKKGPNSECQFYYGYANKALKQPVTNSSLFNAASISKPLAALTALKLFKQYKYSIHAPINKYLESWKLKSAEFDTDKVNLANLLSHSAGITGFRCRGYQQNQKMPTLIQALTGIKPANTPAVTMVSNPDTKFEYSPAAYMILQQLIEDITQQSFSIAITSTLLKPLAMNDSTFKQPLPRRYLVKIAYPYLPNGEQIKGGPLNFVASAAGGLWTNANDLIKFISYIQQAKDNALIKQYLSPTFSHNWGLGIQINLDKNGDEEKQGQYFGHGGFNSGYLSFILGHRSKPLGFAVLINTAPLMTTKGDVVQFDFIKHLNKQIAKSYRWP